jgi:hypothetical protein
LISDRFEIDDLGQLKYYLGINIETHKDHITLNQSSHITKLVEKYQLLESRPTSKIFPQENLSVLSTISLFVQDQASHLLMVLARYQGFPNLSTCHALKHLLKYLKTLASFSLVKSTVLSACSISGSRELLVWQ